MDRKITDFLIAVIPEESWLSLDLFPIICDVVSISLYYIRPNCIIFAATLNYNRVMDSLPLLILCELSLVVVGDLLKKVTLYRAVLDLLSKIQVHSVVVGRELVTLEELDGSLIELKHYDLV